MPFPMSASDVYAQALCAKNEGSYECHWCASASSPQWVHDDSPPTPFVKSKTRAKRPGNPFVCKGCWLWARKRTTVTFLDGTWKDGQCAMNHGWWVTASGARAVKPQDHGLLYQQLLKPPHRFLLCLVTPGTHNLLHCAVANDLLEIKSSTPLRFTLDNIEMTFTVHELEDALRNGPTGKEPGVQALVRFLGSYDLTGAIKQVLPPAPVVEDRGRGRPWSGTGTMQDPKATLLKPISKSGG